MGGKAFDRLATRLTTAQHRLISAHCQAILKTILPDALVLAHYTEKELHGDIDITCAWPGLGLGHFTKGQSRGRVKEVGEEIDVSTISCTSSEKELDLWTEAIARRLGGVEYTRYNYETPILSIAAPCSTFCPTIEEKEPFYQIDILLVPPPSLQLTRFLTSYGSPLILLFAAVRALSPSLTLQATFLSICHSPYPHCPPVRIILTSSLDEVIKWLGLDIEQWDRGFANEEAFWNWLIQVRYDRGVLAHAWERVVQGVVVSPGQGTRRKRVWEGFRAWLLELANGEAWFPEGAVDEKIETTVKQDSKTVKKAEILKQEVVSPAREKLEAVIMDQKGLLAHPMIESDKPRLLNQLALDALDRWGKRQEFDYAMQEAKLAAEEAVRRRLRKTPNRAKAKAAKAKKDKERDEVDEDIVWDIVATKS